MQPSSSSSTRDWEDDATRLSTGYADAFEAAWFLTRSPLWRVVKHRFWGPYALGIVLAALVVAMILLSPATDSHFIYTDF